MGKLIGAKFYLCGFIRSIVLQNITEIGEKAFYICRNLETVVIPETVIKIDPDAFAYSGLKSITLLDGRLTEIGEGTFYKCSNLESIVIPDSVTKIGPYAFADSGLKLIILPDGIEIGEDAFHDCNNLVVKYRNQSNYIL